MPTSSRPVRQPIIPAPRARRGRDPRMPMTRRERRRPEGDDRRGHRRVPANLLRSLSAHLSGGSHVTLLDLSQAGVRLETTRHMRPGQMVSLRFSMDDQQVTINAAVVRSAVVRLDAEEVRYETGLSLVDEFSSDAVAARARRAARGRTAAPSRTTWSAPSRTCSPASTTRRASWTPVAGGGWPANDPGGGACSRATDDDASDTPLKIDAVASIPSTIRPRRLAAQRRPRPSARGDHRVPG